jgi:hypothetical protein
MATEVKPITLGQAEKDCGPTRGPLIYDAAIRTKAITAFFRANTGVYYKIIMDFATRIQPLPAIMIL